MYLKTAIYILILYYAFILLKFTLRFDVTHTAEGMDLCLLRTVEIHQIIHNNMFNLYSTFHKLKDAVQKQKHSRQSIHIIITVLSQSINQLSSDRHDCSCILCT